VKDAEQKEKEVAVEKLTGGGAEEEDDKGGDGGEDVCVCCVMMARALIETIKKELPTVRVMMTKIAWEGEDEKIIRLFNIFINVQ
jgi:hypothetical protein